MRHVAEDVCGDLMRCICVKSASMLGNVLCRCFAFRLELRELYCTAEASKARSNAVEIRVSRWGEPQFTHSIVYIYDMSNSMYLIHTL